MRLRIKFVSIIFITLIIGLLGSILIKAESVIEEDNTLIDSERVEQAIYYNSNHIIVKNNKIYIGSLVIPGIIKDYIIQDKYAYLIVISDKNYLYLLDNNEIKKQVEITITNPETLCIYNKEVLVGGENNLQMTLVRYNSKLEVVKTINYHSLGFTKCVKMLVLDNYLYVAGEKDAIFDSEIFKNVGNKGEIKSFIFKLDSNFTLVKDGYFNELSPNEKIIDMFIFNNSIGVILKGFNKYQYLLDIGLNVIDRFEIDSNALYISTDKTVKSAYIYIKQLAEVICVEACNNTISDSIISFEGEYVNHCYVDGELYIYYTVNNDTYLKTINEYHIDYINNLHGDYFNVNENDRSHFKVESYLEDLNFELSSITPYFVKNQSGKYVIIYIANRLNGDDVMIQTPLIIDEYVNVLDEFIYPKGYQLLFFGSATLNGKKVNNGCTLTDTGVNNLVITNINNEQFSYQFMVVDNYYKTNYIPNIKADISASQNETIYIPLSKKEVKSVVVNDALIGNIQKVNNEYTLCLNYNLNQELLKVGIQELKISKIIYSDNTEALVNLRLIVNIKKQEPTIHVLESKEDNHLNLVLDIVDKDQSIVDLVFETYQNNKLINSTSTFIQNTSSKINGILLNEEFEVYINLITENKTYQILYYKGKITKDKPINYNVTFAFDNNSLKKINIDIDLDNSNILHQILKLGNESLNLNTKYQVKRNNTIIYISVISSIIIIGGLIILVIRKKRRKKSNI